MLRRRRFLILTHVLSWSVLLLVFPAVGFAQNEGASATEEPRAEKSSAEKPNIVLVMADDMGFSDLGAYGGEIDTPNLDRLAAEGMRFSSFYNTSRCSPTRAALLTGLYPHQAGVGFMVEDLGPPAYQGYLNDRSLTIAEALGRAGYRTLMTGKWHVGSARGHWPLDRGFDRFYGIPRGGGVYFWPTTLDRPVVLGDSVAEPPPGWYSTDAFTDYAIDFLEEAQADEKPFFLYVSYIAPHWPLQAFEDDIATYEGRYDDGWDALRAERYERLGEQGLIDEAWPLAPRGPDVPAWDAAQDQAARAQKMATYAAVVDRMDQNVGRLLGALDSLGIADNTLVLFLSDNGGAAAEVQRSVPSAPMGSARSFVSYGRPWAHLSNTPFPGYKKETYEGGIATPLIARWPGVVEPGSVTDALGHVIDFMPTFLEMAGASYPEARDGQELIPLSGRSLLPVLCGETDDGHDVLFWEHHGSRALRVGRWKLVALQNEAWELYDMEADRTEQHDLAEEHPDKVKELADRYDRLADRYGVLPWEEVQAWSE